MLRSCLLGLGLVALACGHAAPPAAQSAGAPPASAVDAQPTTAPPASAVRALPELVKEFEAEGATDVERCQRAFIPVSTFKIPNSMIALETGVVEGPDTIMKWDHKQYWVDAWNQDLKFRDAFRVSCVPCYQAIARQVGDKVEQEWVTKLDYGNHDTSGGVDRFWLWGGLRISPLGQIDFLRRFDGNKLPISERTADIVRDIMTLDVTEKYVLRAKTGSTAPPQEPLELGWFVGWLELGERRVFFATLLDGHRSDVDPLPARRRVTERVLKDRGLM